MRPLESPSYLLQHVVSVVQRQTDQVLMERLGVGMSQYRILIMLAQHSDDPEPVDQRRIADSLGQTEASISRQVKLLAEKGMLTATVDPRERRRRLLTLTVKGHKIVQAAEEVLAQQEQTLFAPLTDRQRVALQEILAALHEVSCAPGKPMACDQAHDIASIYASHKDTAR